MKLVLLALLALCPPSRGRRTLALFPLPFKSHHHLAQGIVGALLKAGHEVTWVTPFPKKDATPGLSFIDVSETKEVWKDMDPLQVSGMSLGTLMDYDRNVSIVVAANKDVQRAMAGPYDAIVTSTFFSDLNCGFAAVMQVPWIVLATTILHSGVEMLVDDVHSAALVPHMRSDRPIPMDLWERMSNTAATAFMVGRRLYDISVNEKHYHDIFGPIAKRKGVVLPAYTEAVYNISILFVNSHPSLAPATSVPPNVVDIAGFHIADHHSPLPKDLQDIMDSSNGVIYFSMGSIVQASSFPAQLRANLIRILGALPYTVLWKFEEPLEGLPKNVHVRPWMPQPAILAHPKTKLFMTHGGLLSTLEAVQAGVPLLAAPVFGDQPGNARRAERAGYALSVPFGSEMGRDLKVALHKILTDKRSVPPAVPNVGTSTAGTSGTCSTS